MRIQCRFCRIHRARVMRNNAAFAMRRLDWFFIVDHRAVAVNLGRCPRQRLQSVRHTNWYFGAVLMMLWLTYLELWAILCSGNDGCVNDIKHSTISPHKKNERFSRTNFAVISIMFEANELIFFPTDFWLHTLAQHIFDYTILNECNYCSQLMFQLENCWPT